MISCCSSVENSQCLVTHNDSEGPGWGRPMGGSPTPLIDPASLCGGGRTQSKELKHPSWVQNEGNSHITLCSQCYCPDSSAR